MIFADEALYNADTGDILLHTGVEVIVLGEHLVKHLGGIFDDQREDCSQHDERPEEYQTDPWIDDDAHYYAAYQHDGRSYRDSDNHLECILEVGDVGSHTGDQTSSAVFVDVGEGERLDIREHCVA